MFVDLVYLGDLPAASSISSSAWTSPTQKDTKEMVGISPAKSSSRWWTQPAQAVPVGCVDTSTYSWELEPTQSQLDIAYCCATHRDGM